jgi:heme exporter protein C
MNPKHRLLAILDLITAFLFVLASLVVFTYAPLEATMGQVQKVFYFHLASAWVGMLGFLVAVVAGVAYLITSRRQWDIAGLAAIEVSLVFFFITIVSGSIWARPTWGTWWNWDPRLTSAAIVELVYAAYMMLRQGIEDPDRRARFGAVYSIIAFISIPITFVSIRLLRTIHPVLIAGSESGSSGMGMTPKMVQTLLFSLFVFSFVFADLFWHRIRLGQLADKVEQLRLKASE